MDHAMFGVNKACIACFQVLLIVEVVFSILFVQLVTSYVALCQNWLSVRCQSNKFKDNSRFDPSLSCGVGRQLFWLCLETIGNLFVRSFSSNSRSIFRKAPGEVD